MKLHADIDTVGFFRQKYFKIYVIWPKFDEKHILGVNDLTISQFSVLVVAFLFPVESGHWTVI